MFLNSKTCIITKSAFTGLLSVSSFPFCHLAREEGCIFFFFENEQKQTSSEENHSFTYTIKNFQLW